MPRLRLARKSAVFTALLGAVWLGGMAAAQPTVPQTVFNKAALQQDFDQLYSGLQQAHYDLYAHYPKTRYDSDYETYRAQIEDGMSRLEAQVLFQRFVALGGIAHATTTLPFDDFMAFREADGAMLPLFLLIDEEQVTIDTVTSKEDALGRGMVVTAIDGAPINAWLDRVRTIVSADNDALSNSLIEQQLPFLLWMLDGERAQYTVTAIADGTPVTVTVDPLSRPEQDAIEATLYAPPVDARKSDASDDNDGDDTAPRAKRMLSERVAYLRPGPFYNVDDDSGNVWDEAPFKRFVDDAFSEFLATGAEALLIDLRLNPGGNSSFSDPMLAWIADRPFRFASRFEVKVSPQAEAANLARLDEQAGDDDVSKRYARLYREHREGEVVDFDLPYAQPKDGEQFKGQVYVLVDRTSYSNAVSVAAIVQDYGFGTVLGEKTADLATTFGAMERFQLDNPGIEVGFPNALIIRPNGARTPDGVTPDILIDSSRKDAEDVLASALSIIERNL